ncbi:MAG TPA: hypothetical protein VK619_05365, partial [Pyrinomonadaceae bacterium]|nr:hypothetical protein [Pyrinomonadaceae bacterium]
RVAPGRYSLRAVAIGFNDALFTAVQVYPSDELIYRFNLEPSGQGRTAPERRRDRNDPRYRVRGAQARRSIFQMQEGENDQVAIGSEQEDAGYPEAVAVEAEAEQREMQARTTGVIETYVATSSATSSAPVTGVNFAVSRPVSRTVDLVFAGQTGTGANAPQRLETLARVRVNDEHSVSVSAGGMRINAANLRPSDGTLGQFSVRAVDEWVVRDSVVIVVGLDYSKFVGISGAHAISPRLGVQYDANARTRVKAAYAPGGGNINLQSLANFEDSQIAFNQPVTQPVALVDGRAVMERSRRLEFGIERVLDDESTIEATGFFDMTSGRGVGLLSMPLNALNGAGGDALLNVANQQGNARGLRVVYSRHITRILNASAGYSFGRGQKLSSNGLRNPAEVFSNGFFQTAALQLGADLPTGTRIHTVFRFSPRATIFAIDPFAGRLAVYDPSLSILITQELPTFGLPVRAEAVIDARNLLDTTANADDGEKVLFVNSARRSLRGGISVRF